MKRLTPTLLGFTALLSAIPTNAQDKPAATAAPFPAWQHTGMVTILTTPEGANLPATVAVDDFPLLVRLHKDFFDFKQAKANGEDLRFSSSTGAPLSYQIEAWDAANGTACLWVRIPHITGNARQSIKLYWGKADAASESNGKAVFNESNGYLSVWHMTEPVTDEVGTLESKDVGTTPTNGMIGTWGPIVTPILLHKGLPPRYAIGSVNTAEVVVATASVGTLIATAGKGGLDGAVILAMLAGGVIASPIAALAIRYVPARAMGVAVAGLLLLTNATELIPKLGLSSHGWFVYIAIVAVVAVAGMAPRWVMA
ncbi:MAG: DUF2341 domain-containing protein [Synechococcaceae cyanobacterium ELA182]